LEVLAPCFLGHASLRATISFGPYSRFSDRFFPFLVTFLSFCDKKIFEKLFKGKIEELKKIWKKKF